jgi:hypothetical protein
MTIRLDHTIVPAKDKLASAEFFAEMFGLRVEPEAGHFAQVRINESLTFDFAERGSRGERGGRRTDESHHYAFQSARWSSRRSLVG